MMMTLLLIVAGVNAQKIDQRLTGLVEKVNTRRAQGQRPIDAKAVNKSIAVRFNADGSTRVKRAVVVKEDGGKVYETEAEIKALTTDDTTSSHGTHTSATAGGSEVGNGMQGVAPEADLILCGLENYASASNIADCINFIFDYAASVNKPAVVSISLGSILGLHDGSDVVSSYGRYCGAVDAG
jgi:hypothetical protein